MWWYRTGTLVIVAILSAACGFQPLYGGGKRGHTAGEMASVYIQPIDDRSGQLLRNALRDLLNPYGPPDRPAYRLEVTLSESKSELAVKKSEVATRANLLMTANFSLFEVASDRVVFSGTSTIVGSYNILNSDYSTLVAENEARSRVLPDIARAIQNRLSAYFRLTKSAPAAADQP